MQDTAASRIARARDERASTLDLSGLDLKNLPDLMEPLPRLISLDLSRNRLQSLPAWLWKSATLESLDLGQNRLPALDAGIGQLVRLRRLDLSENRLTSLPETLSACRDIERIDLYGNLFESVPPVLGALPRLERIDLAGNRIQRLVEMAGPYSHLDRLDLSHNRIDQLAGRLLLLNALRMVDLSQNRLARLEANDLPPHIESLRLDDNRLTYVARRIIEAPLHNLSLEGNPVVAGLAGYLPIEARNAAVASIDRLVTGGPVPGVRNFDAAPRRFDFQLEVAKANVPRVLDSYYKGFGGMPVSMRFGDGLALDLAQVGRKSAVQIASNHATGAALVQFQPSSAVDQTARMVDFAKRALGRLDGVRLVTASGSMVQAPPTQPEARTAPVAAAKDGASAPVFHFVLKGKYARGSAMVVRSTATLGFRHDVPPVDALAIVADSGLDAARAESLDIVLQLSVRGQLEIVGPRSRTAKFLDGRMTAPVNFKIEAGEEAGPRNAVHVDFIVRGETVHQSDFEIALVADTGSLLEAGQRSGSVPATLVADAAGIVNASADRIELTLSFQRRSNLRFDLRHLHDGIEVARKSYLAPGVDRTQLEVGVGAVRNLLAPCYVDTAFWNSFDGELKVDALGKAQSRSLRRTVDTVACAGYELTKMLRGQGALAKAVDYIDTHATEATVLTIRTDDIFLPWEILYPRQRTPNMTDEQDAKWPLDASLFWGSRFSIETVQQRGTVAMATQRRAQMETAPRVIAHLDPGIKGQPEPFAVQDAWIKRMCQEGAAISLSDNCKDARATLQNGQGDPTLIYVYCHGQSPNAFGGIGEKVDLMDGCALTPGDISVADPYRVAPIVFFNSCGSGAYSALTFSSFLAEFRSRGALGMIATTGAVPIVFGAYFAEDVLASYLARRGSLASSLLRLRRKHLLERGNPVPLFYTLQCQLTFPDPP